MDTFNSNLNNYIKSENLKVDKSVDKELLAIKKDVSSLINNEISLINISISKVLLFQVTRTYLNYYYKFYYLVFAAIAVWIILIFLINIKDISASIKWTGYSFFTSGLLVIIPSVIVLLSKFVNNIAIGNITYKKIVIEISNTSFTFLAVLGSILTILGILIILASQKLPTGDNL